MTEDDTFRALKKATFEQMREKFIEIASLYRLTGEYEEWAQVREDTAKRFGWSVKEYQKENFIRIHR